MVERKRSHRSPHSYGARPGGAKEPVPPDLPPLRDETESSVFGLGPVPASVHPSPVVRHPIPRLKFAARLIVALALLVGAASCTAVLGAEPTPPEFRAYRLWRGALAKDPAVPQRQLDTNLAPGVHRVNTGGDNAGTKAYDFREWLALQGVPAAGISMAVASAEGAAIVSGTPEALGMVDVLLMPMCVLENFPLAFTLSVWEWQGNATTEDLRAAGWSPEAWKTPTGGTIRRVSSFGGDLHSGTRSSIHWKAEAPDGGKKIDAAVGSGPGSRTRITTEMSLELEPVVGANGDDLDISYSYQSTLASGQVLKCISQTQTALGVPVWIYSIKSGDGTTLGVSLLVRYSPPSPGQLPKNDPKLPAN